MENDEENNKNTGNHATEASTNVDECCDETENGASNVLDVSLSTTERQLSLNTPELSVGQSIISMQKFFNFDEIVIKEKVGHGSYGTVYKAELQGRLVAVKEFVSADQKAIEIEIKQLSRVRHPNIIALFGISSHQNSQYLLMEYAEGGSLHNFLHGKVKPQYTTAHAMNWARQCAEGVAYLHDMKPKPLIHRDLKPLNLLLTNKGRHLKICDFGTVVDKSTVMTNNKGSAAWMAPEVFSGQKYTEKCDIFSWAIVLWEVLSRQQPFKEMDNACTILWKIYKGERPPLIEDCPEPIQDLMTSCWAEIPEMRPSMNYVVQEMNKLVILFPGADEPLEYQFINQQIISPIATDDTASSNYIMDFSTFNSMMKSSTSTTPTNNMSLSSGGSSTPTPTNDMPDSNVALNSPPMYKPTIEVIPEEPAEYTPHGIFNSTTSEGASKRYETIRHGIQQMVNTPMAPIFVDVDPNAWNLPDQEADINTAKSDEKQCLTVTDSKPISLPLNNTIPTGYTPKFMQKALGHLPTSTDLIESDENLDLNDSDILNANISDTDDEDEQNTLMASLDPDFQPESPIDDYAESQQLYKEHCRLAKEYLRLHTNLYYVQDYKQKLLLQMNPEERKEKQDYLKKIKEKEELLELFNHLHQQLEQIRDTEQQQQQQQYQQQQQQSFKYPMQQLQQNQLLQQQQQQLRQLHPPNQNGLPPNDQLEDGWVFIAPNPENS